MTKDENGQPDCDSGTTPGSEPESRAPAGSGVQLDPPVPGVPGLAWKADDGLAEWEWGFFLVYDAKTRKVTFENIFNVPPDPDAPVYELAPGSMFLGPLPPQPALGWGNAAES